jgi:hypothetical protein
MWFVRPVSAGVVVPEVIEAYRRADQNTPAKKT